MATCGGRASDCIDPAIAAPTPVRTASGGNGSQRFYWEVKAVRVDVGRWLLRDLKQAEPEKRAPLVRMFLDVHPGMAARRASRCITMPSS